ncbi:MAG: single-stranded DNA-binding protein [Opitutaceae bacterium]|nr:single-stranded DNA-binding protein [Opitutaceae bacterium]
MPNFNKVYLMGYLTRDPELRVTPKGTAIAQYGIAVNRSFKGEDGQSREEVTFVDMEAWGKIAETIGKYLHKGSPIFIEGRLKLDQWEDKASGQKRSKLKVVTESFQFLGKGAGDGNQGEPPARPRPAAQPSTVEDEDVPF